MALTNNVIARGRNNIGEIIGGANFIHTELTNFIEYLNSNSHFQIFCSDTDIGGKVVAQLNQINSVVSEKLISGIESLARITESFLSSQEQINAGNFSLQSSPIAVPIKSSIPIALSEFSNTFSARELNVLIHNVKVHLSEISNETQKVADNCRSNAHIFASEDSNIAGAYDKIGEALNTVSHRLTHVMEVLTDQLEKYVTYTLENEYETAQEIEKINTVVDDVMAELAIISSI